MEIIKSLFAGNPRFWVALLYHDIWRLRGRIQKSGGGKIRKLLYKLYWQSYGSFVGLGAELEDVPVFPHGPFGIFISNSAHIGKNCVIFHQVTIGSNMVKGSKGYGAPTLEDNIYIGCGAKIIGNVHIGHNARIGANAVVVKDVPANSVTVLRNVDTIVKNEELDNIWIPNNSKI